MLRYYFVAALQPSRYCLPASRTCAFGTSAAMFQDNDWRRQMDVQQQRRKIIPELVYMRSPWQYLLTKINLWRLRFLWDRDFVEKEFIRGSKQAAIVLTNIIRSHQANEIRKYTTQVGYEQIIRDMLLSRNDNRLQLIKFETEHLRRAMPLKALLRSNEGRRYCFIDMIFVGLRNTKDFETTEEVVEMKQVLDELIATSKSTRPVVDAPHRIVFAEIFIRFRREYTGSNSFFKSTDEEPVAEWAVSTYKIVSFAVLNYDPPN